MKLSQYLAAAAAVATGVSAAHEKSTHAVLRFTNKSLVKVREDPIVDFGKVGKHVHNVMGGSAFSKTSTGEDLLKSKCSNARVKGDFSAYWTPLLYFRDPETGELEDVDIYYVNVYYFFEATDDDIEPFPTGLKILGGDPNLRTAPKSGSATNLDPTKGPIQPVKFTCPRLDPNAGPSWPPNSDGTTAGMQDPINTGEGVGFPDVTCDGYASPLRADIHMPSCYNPEKGLDNHKENMAWPSPNGAGKLNCPEGHIHVPHLFFEVYWDTPKFQGRWTEGKGKQPFVLSNGDSTGFSSHADFLAAWDQDALRKIIDTCKASDTGNGMDQCAGVEINDVDCTIEPGVDEKITGPLSVLPGKNPLSGWDFGLDALKDIVGDILDGDDDDSESKGLPVSEKPDTNVVENAAKPAPPAEKAPEAPPAPAPAPVPAPIVPAPEPVVAKVEQPKVEVHTVWETVIATEKVYAQPTPDAQVRRRHLHGHVHGRRRSH